MTTKSGHSSPFYNDAVWKPCRHM